MSIKSSGASLSNLGIATPIALPAVFGMWVKTDGSVGGSNLFTWCDASLSVQTLTLFFDVSVPKLYLEAVDAGTIVMAGGTSYAPAKFPSFNAWHFVLIRVTNPYFYTDVIYPDGTMEQMQVIVGATFSSAMSAILFFTSAAAVGAARLISGTGGSIAEWWALNGAMDVPDTVILDPAYVRAIAYRGPAYFPNLYKKLVDYKELRMFSGLLNTGGGRSARWGRTGASQQQGWNYNTSKGTIVTDIHPNLPYTYERPSGFLTLQPSVM